MRYLVLIVSATLSACSGYSVVPASECGVSIFSGELTDGLVELNEDMEDRLRAQLPDAVRARPFCWYQTPSGNLEAQLFDEGYEFEFKDGQWRFLKKNEYLVMWHERKR